MSRPPTFPEYARQLADAVGVRLEPWQERMLEALYRGERQATVAELELASRRSARRYRAALALASAALGGVGPVTIVGTDAERSHGLIGDALAIVNRYGHAVDVDVEPARQLLERARAGITDPRQPQETAHHDPPPAQPRRARR